jgi:hypothetical protein
MPTPSRPSARVLGGHGLRPEPTVPPAPALPGPCGRDAPTNRPERDLTVTSAADLVNPKRARLTPPFLSPREQAFNLASSCPSRMRETRTKI